MLQQKVCLNEPIISGITREDTGHYACSVPKADDAFDSKELLIACKYLLLACNIIIITIMLKYILN